MADRPAVSAVVPKMSGAFLPFGSIIYDGLHAGTYSVGDVLRRLPEGGNR